MQSDAVKAELKATADALSSPGKGFLASDESAGPWLRAGHAEAKKIPDTADEQQKPKEEEPETPTSNIKPLEIEAGQMAATAMGLFVLAHPREEGQEVGM